MPCFGASSGLVIPWGYLEYRDATEISIKVLDFVGEPVGIRTRDLLIKSQLLYRLSYGLAAAVAT